MKEEFVDQFNFQEYLEILLKNIFKIIGLLVISLILWLVNYITADRVYEIKSLVQVENQSKTISSDLDAIFSANSNVALDEQILIYTSRSNMLQLVENLNTNIKINGNYIESSGSNIKLNKAEYLSDFLNFETVQYAGNLNENNTFTLTDTSQNEKVFNFNEDFILNDAIRLNLEKNDKLQTGDEFTLTILNPNDEVMSLQSKFNVRKVINERFVESSLLSISILSPDVYIARRIIDEANLIFEEQSTKANSVEAANSVDYLNKQIAIYDFKLNEAEQNLNKFMMENLSVDFSLESKGLFDKSVQLADQKKEVELKIAEIGNKFKENNPIFINLQSQLQFLEKEEKLIQKEISNLPSSQQEYLKLSREVEINKSFIESLINARLEFSLIEASTISNVRIIDSAYKGSLVSPRLLISFSSTIVFVLFTSALAFLIFEKFFTPVISPAQISRTQRGKILGIIPNNIEDISIYDEAVNAIVTNMKLVREQSNGTNNISLIIGPTKKVGKTLTAFNIAKKFSERGRKTLILDCDYKRGDIHELTGQKTLKNANYSELNIEDFKISENFYSIPRPKGMADLAINIFESIEFENFVTEIKNNFDEIIIDTPPVLSLSDTLVLIKFSNLLLTVVRHNVSKVDDLTKAQDMLENVGYGEHLVIYNDFKANVGYYGYDPYLYKYYRYKSYDYRSE